MVMECKSCRGLIEETDTFCRLCGRRQAQSPAWYYHPVWILILTLTVLGPLAIPLALRSPLINRRQRIALTVAIAIFSVFLIVQLYHVVTYVMGQWSSLNAALGDTGL